MSNSEEIFREAYSFAFWFAYGKSDETMRVAVDFANYYALSQVQNEKPQTGIPQAFKKWISDGGKPYTTLLPE